jgi:hypothetical protein
MSPSKKKAPVRNIRNAPLPSVLPEQAILIPQREYIYSFELSRPFPSTRAFIFKKQLSKSISDTFMELFGSAKKRSR